MSKQGESTKQKRIGRPTKPPKPGERVPLGLRVTPEMKERLEAAAIKNGRSLSQEAELRLERSLAMQRHLIIAWGDFWSPVVVHNSELLIPIGDDPRYYPVPPEVLKISDDDLERLRNYFGGTPRPYTHTEEEIMAEGEHWLEMQDEIRRGK